MQTRDQRDMTSGPEDIVKRLIDHLESQAGADAADQPDAAQRGGGQTARILSFAPGRSMPPRLAGAKGGVVDLARARKARAEARTVSGLFVYTARL